MTVSLVHLRTALVAASALAAAATSPRMLGAQEARPVALPAAPTATVMTAETVDARLRAIADPAARESIVATISAAGRRGLPMEPLVVKALEGIEKGAPPTRIESAVRALAGRLATASQALAPVVSPIDLATGADALGAGVPADVLREIRSVSGGRSTAVALGVVAQLTARRVPPTQAGAAVAFLVKRGASPAQIVSLERMVNEDLAAGLSPSTAIDLRMRTLTAALPPAPVPAAATAADAPEALGGQRSGPPTPRKRP